MSRILRCDSCGNRRSCCVLFYPGGFFCHRCRGVADADCEECAEELERPANPLTRQERLQELADSGVDTWEEKKGER